MFTTAGDVSATPAVDGKYVHVPDWGGKLWSIDRETGTPNWSIDIGDYNGLPPVFIGGPGGGLSRATPAVHGDSLILGDQAGREFVGSSLLPVNKNTGALNWITLIDDHPAAMATQSPVVHGDTVYVGVASNEEGYAAFVPNYPCCSSRGSVVALDANTGAILWQTYMAPDSATGFSGNSVWGSTPLVDTKRGSVYVTTGNNFSAPPGVLACVVAAPDEAAVNACVDGAPGGDQNHFDSIVALDMNTGAVKWATKLLPYDAWTVACFPLPLPNPGNCPMPSGPDFDFAQGPALFTVHTGSNGNGKPRDLLGAGQKSSQYWALDAATGAVLFSFPSGGSVGSGAAVVNGTVYRGSGYGVFGPNAAYTGNNKLYAFEVP